MRETSNGYKELLEKKVNKRDYMEVMGVDRKIILKGTLKKQT
jgi:hypothetical protein